MAAAPSSNAPSLNNGNIEGLHLDRIPATISEIGPAPADGGYGWMILAAAFIYNLTISTVIVTYGIIIVKANNEGDSDGPYSIWKQNIGLVPILFVVMRLLLEAWCRVVVSVFHSPRLMALSGLCLTVAGVLLSSFATNTDDNEFIINVFSGLFAGAGSALTGQQSEVILKHYFKQKLSATQSVYRVAPAVGNCLAPALAGFLCNKFTNDIVLTIYGAVLMQNCFFLAAYTRPIYVTKPLTRSYKMLKDAVEDEDEDIFTKRQPGTTETSFEPTSELGSQTIYKTANTEENDEYVIATSKTIFSAREIIDASVQHRFSSDFTHYTPTSQQHELNSIDERPQPLYRETTVTDGSVFAFSATQGSARRTASVRKNFISVLSMLGDIDFYLYSLLHLTTTYCNVIVCGILPALVSERLPSLSTSAVATLTSVTHIAACSLTLLSLVLPRSLHKMARLCAAFCIVGAAGSYGVSTATQRGWLVVWGSLASFACSSTSVLQQPLYDDTLNEFDAAATSFTANFLAAAFLMLCCNIDFSYATCFNLGAVLQAVTACVFIVSYLSPKRR